MNDTDPIHPLKEVWLRPRRVFRALSKQPVGALDYILAAAQTVSFSTIFSFQTPEVRAAAGKFIAFVPLAGLLNTFIYSLIYARLGKRAGGSATRNQIFHILAYGGVPQVAAMLLWLLAFLLLGEAPWLNSSGREADGLVWIVARLHLGMSVLLFAWSYLLQVMGFSEVLGLSVRKSLAVWVLGQLIYTLAGMFLISLLPQLAPPG